MRRNIPADACECAGTALMLFWGITAVALMCGAGSPVPPIATPATVSAATGAQLRRVTRESFGQVLSEDPVRTGELLRQLARRVREAGGRLAGGP